MGVVAGLAPAQAGSQSGQTPTSGRGESGHDRPVQGSGLHA